MIPKIKSGKNLKNPYITSLKTVSVLFEQSDNKGDKYRIIVPKKYTKSAVKRNRIKRKIRGVVTEHLKTTETTNTEIVIIGKDTAYKTEYKTIKNEFEFAIKKYTSKLKEQSQK